VSPKGLGVHSSSTYRNAIDLTRHALERRSRYFRNQVVLVVIVSVGAVVWALVARSFSPLVSTLLVVPLCGSFFFADGRVIEDWQSDLLEMWARRELDLAALREAIRANPALPRETTEGMLATLPDTGELFPEQRMSTPTRRAIAAAALAFHRVRLDAIVAKTLVSALIAGALIAAVTIRRWEPLVALASPALLPGIATWRSRRHFKDSEGEVAACRTQPDFSEPEFVRLVAGYK
jgi:hypothetical protein